MAAQRMCTADAFHAETQQHATNAAVMYAGSAENVHSRHRLHIEKNVWGACLAGSTEDVHSSSDQRNSMPWYQRCYVLAAQRMCTATDVLKILRAAGSTANVHSRCIPRTNSAACYECGRDVCWQRRECAQQTDCILRKMSGEPVLLAAQRMCTAAATSGIVCHGTGGAVCWQRRECAQPPTC